MGSRGTNWDAKIKTSLKLCLKLLTLIYQDEYSETTKDKKNEDFGACKTCY